MTNPVTPNIGLNKIDRTSPSTTYFDLEKYIDQNADAVDRFAGESSDAIGALEKRLDTEERREVVLQPGLQIVNAERSAPFKLSGIKGRTLVNLLGRDGNCERVDAFSRWFNSNQEVDTTNKVFGSGSLKITVTTSVDKTGGIFKVMTPLIKSNSYYILKCYFKNIDLPDSIKPEVLMKVTDSEGDRLVGNYSGNINKNAFTMTYGKAYTKSNLTEFVVYARVPGGSAEVGNSFNIDGFSLYEISASEYDALDNMTLEQVDAKYPYVDSVQPVRNPYAIRYGENLAPGYSTAILHRSAQTPALTLISTYEVKFTGEAQSQNVDKGVYFDIQVIPGQSYTGAVDTLADNAFIRFEYFKDSSSISNSKWVKTPDFFPSNGLCTATIPAGCSVLRVYITNQKELYWDNGTLINDSLIGGNYHFKNWRVFIGDKDMGFKPREDAMLALQTDLYADPLTGANADEVFEKDGYYFKLAKWKNILLDNNQSYIFHGPKTGFKWINFAIANGPNQNSVNLFLTSKFDGKYINHVPGSLAAGTLPDQSDYDSTNKRIYISISNTDSGWGDNYTPTPDEIKAYFMGWTMYDGSYTQASPDSPANNTYNGTGLKYWARREDGVSRHVWRNATITCPTEQAQNWTPYQLVYQLATTTVEPIVSEGMLTFNEGDNQIEVGTGLVVRESVKPQPFGGAHVINDINLPGSILNHKVEKFLNVYKNGYRDQWEYRNNSAYGNERRVKYDGYDPAAAYSVTYLMLDKSPVVPFSGSYAANEKAMFEELTDSVQQNATAVSVLLNKKADKDAPGWITPTLLNGWNVDTSVGFLKDSDGRVQLRGILRPGATGTVIFRLPNGYRPSPKRNMTGISYHGSTGLHPVLITITTDGAVYADFLSPATWVSIDGSTFLAEQ